MSVARSLLPLLALAASASAFAVFPNNGTDTLFPFVGSYTNTGSGFGSGVVIDPHYVLTSEHDGTATTFELPGYGSFPVAQNIVAPAFNGLTPDLRLLRFDIALPVFTRIDERAPVGGTVALVGFGNTGTEGGAGFNVQGNTMGTRRVAFNRVEGLATITDANDAPLYTALYYTLDRPGSAYRVPGEGGVAAGDSGGGWFYDFGDGMRLVATSEGVIGGDGTNATRYDYDGLGFGAYLGAPESSSFIRQYVPQAIVPEPATLAVLGFGAFALARRRRTRN